MASAASLSEPRVLAAAKRRLFPEPDESDAYALADTQFATDEWLPGQAIPDRVRDQLAPFNHVKIGSGYPDLVGVRQLESSLLSVERFGDHPPLVAVEAKGYTEHGGVDVERGIVQAYDRLHEANAAYAAVPAAAASQSHRALARELNVGMLGITPGHSVEVLETPRIVGNRAPDEAAAIRFQASAQGVADKSFGLNHPKNYLAYPLAIYHPGETEAVLSGHVVGAVDAARMGAAFLDLIDDGPSGPTVTALGEKVIRFALQRYDSIDAALAAFAEWQGSRQRFYDLAPEWGLLTRRIVWAYPATRLIVNELKTMSEDGISTPSLVNLVEWLHTHHPTFTVELFIRGTDDARRRVLDVDGNLRTGALSDGEVYHSPTVFQLKAMLYHAGILQTRGAEPHRLDPETDDWSLCNPLRVRQLE